MLIGEQPECAEYSIKMKRMNIYRKSMIIKI